MQYNLHWLNQRKMAKTSCQRNGPSNEWNDERNKSNRNNVLYCIKQSSKIPTSNKCMFLMQLSTPKGGTWIMQNHRGQWQNQLTRINDNKNRITNNNKNSLQHRRVNRKWFFLNCWRQKFYLNTPVDLAE